jgi:hypothetical protein
MVRSKKMKATFMHLLAALAAMCLWAGAASAQSNLKLRVNVPFSFVAEGTTFSSGEYEVTQLNETVLVLRNLGDHSSAVEKTEAAQKEGVSGVAALVFHRIGDRYFLEQVTTRSSGMAHQLEISPLEKQLAQSRRMPKPNVVNVVAHDAVLGGN